MTEMQAAMRRFNSTGYIARALWQIHQTNRGLLSQVDGRVFNSLEQSNTIHDLQKVILAYVSSSDVESRKALKLLTDVVRGYHPSFKNES